MRLLSKLLLYSFILSFSHSFISPAHAQPYRQLNSAEILLEIKKLNTLGSVLYIAAHPDDENTRLLSYLANEAGARTAYLSLTRGDGGQNLIGTEQGDLLGLIRTQELLAARRIDGAEQFFTRAVDFGFSKSAEESFQIWNKDSVLADVVWVIRKFQPDVIITRFSPEGGGHGHHTASAILAVEAFDAAADPNRFPEQLKYASVWQAKRLVWNHSGRWWNPNADLTGLMTVEVGQYNPLLGKGYGELAAESRSMHKSQGFGSAERRGEMTEYFKHLKGEEAKTGLFEGVNMTWEKRAKNGDKISSLLDQAIQTFDPQKPDKILPHILEAREIFGTDFVRAQSEPPARILAQLPGDAILTARGIAFDNLAANILGVYPEAVATFYSVVPGNSLKLAVQATNRSRLQVTFSNVWLSGLPDLEVKHVLEPNEFYTDTFEVRIPEDYSYTTQYWLREQHSTGLHKIQDKELIGLPEKTGDLSALFLFKADGREIRIRRPILYKWVDPVKGEQYRDLEITPPVMINIAEKIYLFPDKSPRQVKMIVKSGTDGASGLVRLRLPEGWSSEPRSIPFHLQKKQDEQEVSFLVTPSGKTNEAGTVNAVAEINGKEFSHSVVRIDYSHIPIQTLFPSAAAKLIPLEIKLAGRKIGYIPGAGDQVSAALRNIGYEVDELTDDLIANSDLSVYDAIVTGVRAYNTNKRMAFHHQKLMQYVENGGNLVVQYNTSNFISGVSGEMGPYPFKISRDRVTVEEASVTFADPSHPVLNTPNKITQKDFEGWIQERGLYFAKDWDAKYATPLEMNDPGEKPSKGSLIIAPHGKGNFVYTGISFFRELPAGVPGAYRLFVNLLSL